MNNNTTLSIVHNLFITKEQRYSLQEEGAELEVVGVSVPIWYHKGKTSEPAVEVFVKYKLVVKEEKVFIKHNKQGYEINFPVHPLEDSPENEPNVSAEDLLDVRDKGAMRIAFRQYTKATSGKKEFNVLHYVKISDDCELKNSLVL